MMTTSTDSTTSAAAAAPAAAAPSVTAPSVTAPSVTVTWGIANLERNLADGKVSVIHWTATATDSAGVYSASAYGSIGLDGEVVTPFKDLKPEICIQWVKDHFGDEKLQEIASALEAQIEQQRAPKTGSGVPW